MENCIFCKIIRKQAPAKIVYEDEFVLGIIPKEEVSKGHILLITKAHFSNIIDVDENIFSHFAKALKKLSARLVRENKATGINILNANGKDAQQSVPHLHFHLIPRYPNDKLDMWIKQGL